MATALTIEELRSLLRSPAKVRERSFDILKSISSLINKSEGATETREMVLRALEQRDSFDDNSHIIDSLARAVGLFPYADPESLDMRDSIAYEYHRPFNMPSSFVFHREQAAVYRRLLAGENVILSAPTSFGKSKIIDAMIATGRFKNIAVIVPTLALIDETRRRLVPFSKTYKIVTHLNQDAADKNIFVLTPERAIGYEFPKIDFFVIDEFYKIGATEDENQSRTVALNQAFYKLIKSGGQFYLLGPNIQQIPAGLEEAYHCSFYPTSFATVVAEQHSVSGEGSDLECLMMLIESFDEPTLIFCSSPSRVNWVANGMLRARIGVDNPSMDGAARWVEKTYHPDWVLGHSLRSGIGIHHGRLPRSIAQYVVRKFNEGALQFLICTSTLIEGVNTRAKNVVIFDNYIAKKRLDYFTFNNIKGRSGRMFHHFVGKVYIFDLPPQEELPFVDFPIFTQDSETPDALLIQLETADLTSASQKRMERFSNQKTLPMELIKQNASIDPENQIQLALHIAANANTIWPHLAWRAFPKYPQLKFVCELIWRFLVDARRKAGVVSGSQLTQKTWQLWQTKSTARRVLNELVPGKFAANSADEAVERVLEFERSWAGFELPRYLMAVSRIQRHVLERAGLSFGDYSIFASQTECLFHNPIVAALDEYGIPLQLAERIQAHLQTTDNLDLALKNIKELKTVNLRLSEFERELLEDAQSAL